MITSEEVRHSKQFKGTARYTYIYAFILYGHQYPHDIQLANCKSITIKLITLRYDCLLRCPTNVTIIL